MKYLKLLVLALVAAGVASCSDDKKEYNTDANVIVSMAQADISFSENRGVVNVPVKVTGNANGYITVTCTVSEETGSPAMEDVHYLMTAQSINIAAGESVGYFEVKLVDDKELNDNRCFRITLASADGAKIEGVNSTLVTIKDNDSDPYARLGGTWYVPCTDYDGTNPNVREVTIKTFEEGEDGYYDYYLISGLLEGAAGAIDIKAKFDYDERTKTGEIVIEYGQKLPDFTSGGTTYTGELAYFFLYNGEGPYLDDKGTASFTWNEDYTELNIVSFSGSEDVNYDGAGFVYLLLKDGNPASWYDDASSVTTFYRTKP